MVKVPISGLDTFVVISKTLLNDQNHRVLTMLYQPIIGTISIGLYLNLLRYVDDFSSDVFNHLELVNTMQLKLDDIIEAREKLEALGLIKTYLQKGDLNKYVYELYNPLNEFEFVNNPILNEALYNNLTEKEYKRIVDNLTVPKINLKEYEDISSSFSTVYKFKGSFVSENHNIKSVSHLDLSFEPLISFNEIFAMVPSEILNFKSICKETRNLLYKLSFVYNLDNEKMRDVILNSIEDKKIDIDLLKENCRNFYKFEHSGKLPKIMFSQQPTSLRKTDVEDTKKGKIIKQFESMHPFEFLALKQGTNHPAKKDLELVEYLLVELELLPGVVNVLIDYVLKINNNKLTTNFVDAIAVQWKRSQIKTVSDAIDFALKEYDSRKKRVVSKPVKKESKLPEWFNTDIKEEEATDEEIREFERRLMGL